MMTMDFKQVEEVKKKDYNGKKVKVRGWVHRIRDQKDNVFLILRDSSGTVQCVVKKGSLHFDQAQKTTIESSVQLEGTLKEDKRAPDGYEVEVTDYKLVHLAERFPITKDLGEEFLLDNRHLWVRSQKMVAIFKIRSTVFAAIDEYFRGLGFYETHSPMFTPNAAEGGSTLFEVNYFETKTYLAQTWQLYAEALMFGLERIYTIAPSFRAEKSKTAKHLTEYWHAEMEVAWAGLDELMGYGEGLISHICQKVAKDNRKELALLDRDYKELEKIKPPFPRITYTEALEILKKHSVKVPWGKDLRSVEEKAIGAKYDKPVIVTNYPKEVKAFYMRQDPANPDTVLCFDMISPIGTEIIGASERETDLNELIRKIKKEGGNPKNYEWYLDTRRYGSVPHSGFGCGVERVIQWICGLTSIKDAIPFPRTIDRITP